MKGIETFCKTFRYRTPESQDPTSLRRQRDAQGKGENGQLYTSTYIEKAVRYVPSKSIVRGLNDGRT